MTPPPITTPMLYRGAVPFVAIQLVVLGLVFAVPQSATWLPNALFRTAPGAMEAPPPTFFDQDAPEGEMEG